MAPPTNREEVAAKRTAVISAMVSSLKRGESREYHVGLVGYHIEGIPYSATGLSVNPTATPDIDLTDASFARTAPSLRKLLSGARLTGRRCASAKLHAAVLTEVVRKDECPNESRGISGRIRTDRSTTSRRARFWRRTSR